MHKNIIVKLQVLCLRLGVDFTFPHATKPRQPFNKTTSTLQHNHVNPLTKPRQPIYKTTSTKNPHQTFLRRNITMDMK